jgi:hypothetical protein
MLSGYAAIRSRAIMRGSITARSRMVHTQTTRRPARPVQPGQPGLRASEPRAPAEAPQLAVRQLLGVRPFPSSFLSRRCDRSRLAHTSRYHRTCRLVHRVSVLSGVTSRSGASLPIDAVGSLADHVTVGSFGLAHFHRYFRLRPARSQPPLLSVITSRSHQSLLSDGSARSLDARYCQTLRLVRGPRLLSGLSSRSRSALLSILSSRSLIAILSALASRSPSPILSRHASRSTASTPSRRAGSLFGYVTCLVSRLAASFGTIFKTVSRPLGPA